MSMILKSFTWLLAININMLYSDFVCPPTGCCHPKSMRANYETITECELLEIHDCVLLHSSVCYWDCNPIQTQTYDALLAHQGYSNKIFNGIADKYEAEVVGDFEYPLLDLDLDLDLETIFQDSDHEPSTVDEIIAVSGLTTLDDCDGIQYNYELNSIAAQNMLNEIQDGQYDDNREIMNDISIFEDVNITDTIRRLFILGKDDRKHARDHRLLNAVGGIKSDTKYSGATFCTATLIAPRYIITAAHCRYDKGKAKKLGEFFFVPGLDDIKSKQKYKSSPYDRFYIQKTLSFKEWTVDDNYAFDIAVMRLWREVPSAIAVPWKFGARNNIKLDDKFHHYGYPQDKKEDSRWLMNCKYDGKIGTDFLRSKSCDYEGGMSGGPVFDYVYTHPGVHEFIIRCIISHGNRAANTCTRITPTKEAVIRKWINKPFVHIGSQIRF